MAKYLSMAVLLALVVLSGAATPLFLQAITSALATIPFTGGPMSTGLVGAKLGIGTKLLYYLGYFGRRPKSKAVPKAQERPYWGGGALQPLPLPYVLSGGARPVSSHQRLSSLEIDPALLLQALTAQGVDPSVAASALSYAGGMSLPPQGINPGFGINHGFNTGIKPALSPNSNPEPKVGTDDVEDAESFFAFLRDMDENTCISRLICDIGRDPSFLGEFSENIHSMVGSLSVRPSSRAHPYLEIMRSGGQCRESFPECGDASYEVVKSVAPSVDLPAL